MVLRGGKSENILNQINTPSPVLWNRYFIRICFMTTLILKVHVPAIDEFNLGKIGRGKRQFSDLQLVWLLFEAFPFYEVI